MVKKKGISRKLIKAQKEDEICAEFLFGKSDALDEDGDKLWCYEGERVWGTPHFRTDKAWCGELLGRIGGRGDYLMSKRDKDGVVYWLVSVPGRLNVYNRSNWKFTWMDAVVDAVLQNIKEDRKVARTKHNVDITWN